MIVAVKVTVNVSATLIELSIQLINIVAWLNVKNDVLPLADPVTDIVTTISVTVQIDNVEVNVNAGITYEPAA